MQPVDEIKEYGKAVCEQIRWKKAHNTICEEIENHIRDQRDSYIYEGEDEKSATQKAILQMGDAVSIGMELDKTHKPKPQWTMIVITVILIVIGSFARCFFGTSQYSLNSFNVFPAIIAVATFFIAYYLDFTVLGKYAKYSYFCILTVSAISLLFSSRINGRAWFLSINLADLALIFPLAYSLLIYALRNKGIWGIILCGVGYIPFAVILLLVPTSIGFILFTISALAILCVSIAKGWFRVNKKQGLLIVLMPTLLCAIMLFFYLIRNTSFLRRLSLAINPYADPKGYGYIGCLIHNLLSGAKFIGKGVVSSQYGGNIPTMDIFSTDYILTALTHNFGWIVFIGIVVIIIAFSTLGAYYIAKQKSVLGYLVSASIMLTFVLQSVFYIANNLGYGLLDALSLPLVSYGKSSLIINSALIGFMLSVFRTGGIFRDNAKSLVKNSTIFSFEDGKLIINFKA